LTPRVRINVTSDNFVPVRKVKELFKICILKETAAP